MLEAGHILGNYKILSALGSGGMGEVYLAQDARLGRQVAIKVLLAEVANDEERLSRFVREARASSSLNHPNILTIYEIGEADGTHFIAAEYVKGHTLRHVMRHGDLSVDQALDIAHQAANALGAAHAAGIIHRDIKPDNIMVRDDGLVKVLDFGLAKLVDSSPEVSEPDDTTRIKFATEPGKVMGTTAYMSPEQARGHRLDARSDIFSLGIVLYELFSGARPFEGTSSADLISSILKDEPAPIREISPDLPRHLERILTKALRKDPAQRYQQIKDLEIDLGDLRDELRQDTAQQRTGRATLRSRDTGEDGDRQTFASSISTTRRFTILHAAIFLLLIGAVATGLFLYWPGRARTGPGEPVKTVEVATWASQPGEIYSSGTFSPDGKMVAFASTQKGNKQLFVKQATAGESVQVTTDSELVADNPIWSPTGDEIAFFSNRGDRPAVWRTPILGGSPTLVAQLPDGGSQLRRWANSGRIYFESNNELFLIDPNDGRQEKVTELTGLSARWIAIAQDEKQIAFTSTTDRQWSVWAMRLGDATPRPLYDASAEVRNIVWQPDGKGLLFSMDVGGVFQIFSIGLTGSPPVQVTSSERECFALDVSPDGNRVLYGSAKEESDIWSVNLGSGKEAAVASGIEAELWPAVSPDGQTIAYQSVKNLSQGNNLYTGRIVTKKPAERDEPREIVTSGFLPTYSPDGQRLAFISLEGKNYFLNFTPTAGGTVSRLSTEGMAAPSSSLLPYLRVNSTEYSWAPDSTKIAYIASSSNIRNIWIASTDGSPEARLTDNQDARHYLYSPVWSPDGTQLAFTSRTASVSADGKETWALSVIDRESRAARQIVTQSGRLRILGWSADGKEILLASTIGLGTLGSHTDVSLASFSVNGGSRVIGTVKDVYPPNVFLSPGRTTIVYSAYRDGKDDLWLVPVAGGPEKN